MVMAVRIYDTEAKADDVVKQLTGEGLSADAVCVLKPGSGSAAAIKAAVAAEQLPASAAAATTKALEAGRCVVSLPLPYNGQAALEILDSGQPVDTDSLPEAGPPKFPLFSEFLGIPLLKKKRGASASLLSSNTFVCGNVLGLGLLRHKKGTMMGWPVKRTLSGDSSFGMKRLSHKVAPLSSAIGMPVLLDSNKLFLTSRND